MVKFYENITSSDTGLLKDIQKEMDSGKPCAMTVYHPQCGHCTNMKPSWKKMGEHMSSKYNGDLVIALVHMDAIDELPIQRERIQGYPHIIFKTKESENEYHGPRDEESFENWIIDNAKNNKYQLIMNNNGNNGYNNNNDNNNNYNNDNDNHVDITNDVEILDTNFNNNSHMNDPISEIEPTEEPEPNHIKTQFDNLIDSLNIYKTPSPMPRPDSNKDMSLSIKISRPETASKPKTRRLVRKSNKKPTRRMKTKSKSKAITKPKTKSKSVRATRSAKKAKTIRKRKSITKKTPQKKLYTRKIPSTVKRNKRFHDLKTL